MSQTERIVNVIRLQFVNRQPFLWVPLMVFGFAIALPSSSTRSSPNPGPSTAGRAKRRCGRSSSSACRR